MACMPPKNPAAVALGRRGGKARAAKLTPQQRSESARKAIKARWAEHKKTMKRLDKSLAQVEKTLDRGDLAALARTKKAKLKKAKVAS